MRLRWLLLAALTWSASASLLSATPPPPVLHPVFAAPIDRALINVQSQEMPAARKEQLLAAHRAETTLIRAALLRHRGRLLRKTLDEARNSGAAPERLQQIERELAEVQARTHEAEQAHTEARAAAKLPPQ